MAVHLRLTRTGRHKRPLYRVVAADSRKPRDGRFLEILGIFDPLKEPAVPELKQERVLSWLRQGAQPTVTVKTLLRCTESIRDVNASVKRIFLSSSA